MTAKAILFGTLLAACVTTPRKLDWKGLTVVDEAKSGITPQQMKCAIDWGVEYWGGGQVTGGAGMVLRSALMPCGKVMNPAGCWRPGPPVDIIEILWSGDPDDLAIAHEIGHAVSRSASHLDPRYQRVATDWQEQGVPACFP